MYIHFVLASTEPLSQWPKDFNQVSVGLTGMQSVHLKTAALSETRAGAEFSSFPNLSNVSRIPPNMATPSRNTLPLKTGLENYSASVVPFSNGRLRANLPVAPADR